MDDRALAAFLDAAFAAQAEAAARIGTIESVVDLGPVTARLRTCGAPMHRRLTEMLVLADPSAPDDGRPTAELVAFDSATSGVAMPRPPWGPEAYRPGLEVEGLRHGRFLGSYMVDFAALTIYDRERERGIYWALDGPALFACQEAAPLRNVLRWIAMDHGAHLVHAAAVGTGQDGVLILGAKGAGKSTTSLATMLDGLPFVADDFCLLHAQGAAWRATPLTHTARATSDTIALLPALASRITNHGAPADHKPEITVADHLVDGLTIRALTTPVRAPRTGPARPVDQGTFVRSVLAGTVGVFPGMAEETLRMLVQLSEELPCFALPIGPDLAGASATVAELVAAQRPVTA